MISFDDINKYRWEDELSQADRPDCSVYSTIFFKLANTLKESGDQCGFEVYRLLGDISSMYLDKDDPNSPFKPEIAIYGKRSAIPGDFDNNTFAIIDKLVQSTKNIVLKARFADIFWVAKKDHEKAKIAAECYLDNVKTVNSTDHWMRNIDTLERGFYLACILGRENNLFTDYLILIDKLINDYSLKETTAFCLHLFEILFKQRAGDINKLADTAEKIAIQNESSDNYHIVQRYYDIAARMFKAVKREDDAQRVMLMQGESLVKQAESVIGRPHQGYIAGVHFLARAIECFRQNRAPKDKVDKLHKKLREWQSLSLNDMKKIEYTIDISKIVESAQNAIQGKDLHDAIYYLALGHPIINKEELHQRTEKQAKEHPIQHLFQATLLSTDGRVIAHKPSILHASPDIVDNAIEAEMFSQLTHIDWPIRVKSFINVCRGIIRDEHRPSRSDLVFLVYNNPFIPPGHEEIFLKGIHAGFNNELDICAHLLVPQVEESIRHVLKQNSKITSKLDSKFIQEERLLGTLLSLPETVEIFGEDLVFEMRGILCEKHGYDLRNRLAHGFMTYDSCFSTDVLLLWWLVLRLFVYPIYNINSENETEK